MTICPNCRYRVVHGVAFAEFIYPRTSALMRSPEAIDDSFIKRDCEIRCFCKQQFVAPSWAAVGKLFDEHLKQNISC